MIEKAKANTTRKDNQMTATLMTPNSIIIIIIRTPFRLLYTHPKPNNENWLSVTIPLICSHRQTNVLPLFGLSMAKLCVRLNQSRIISKKKRNDQNFDRTQLSVRS